MFQRGWHGGAVAAPIAAVAATSAAAPAVSVGTARTFRREVLDLLFTRNCSATVPARSPATSTVPAATS